MKIQYIFQAMVLALTVTIISSCKSDDTDFSDYINNPEEPTYTDIQIDRSYLGENQEETDVAEEDMVETMGVSYIVTLDFKDNDVEIGGNANAVKIAKTGAHVTVTNTKQGVKFILSGQSSNGSMLVFSDKKYIMELAGLSLTNPNGSAINNQCKKTCYIVLRESSKNILQDGSDYPTESGGLQAKGALFSEGQMIISGEGSLDVYANNRHGIVSDDYIRLRKGIDVYVKVNKHEGSGSGIKANDGVYMNGGVVNIEVFTDGGKGISCEDSIKITNGRLTVLTYGVPRIDKVENDTASCAGIKSDMAFIMKGGNVGLKSSGEGGKGINCKGNIIINGGSLNVVTIGEKGISTPKGIKTDADMTVSGGYVCVFSNKATPIDVAGKLDYGNGTYSSSKMKNTVTISF